MAVALALLLCIPQQALAFTLGASPEELDKAVAALADQKIIASKDFFRPQETLNRAEAVTFLLRTQAVEYVRDTRLGSLWQDVPTDAWYARYVDTATQIGMVQPGADHKFYPDRPVTRAEFLVLMYRLEKAVNGIDERSMQVAKFTDTKPADWFYTAALWAKGSFLASQLQDPVALDPATPLTRAEAALLLQRYWVVMEGPSSAAWLRPLGDILYKSASLDVPIADSHVTYKGPNLAYLPTSVQVYKELVPAPVSSENLAVPALLQDLVPYLGGVLPIHALTLQTMNADGNTLYLSYDPQQPLLQVGIENADVVGTGNVTDQALRLARKLGLDVRRLEMPRANANAGGQNPRGDAYFPLVIDGQPVYDMSGQPAFSLSYAQLPFPTMTIALQQLDLRAQYQAANWQDTLTMAQQRMQQQECSPRATYSNPDTTDTTFRTYVRCEVTIDNAVPVMMRLTTNDIYQNDSLQQNESYLVPGLRLTGMKTLSSDKGEPLLLPVSLNYPRVGAILDK